MNRLPLSVTVSIVVRTGMSAVSLYAHEAVLTTLLLVAAAAVEAWAPPLSTPFFERGDASISYPAIAPTCPVWLLILLSVSVPVAVFIAGAACCLPPARGAPPAASPMGARSLVRQGVLSIALCTVALAQAIILAMAIVNVLKVSVGRMRPNALSLMDYAAFASNRSAYIAGTVEGALGDVARALAPSDLVAEAQRSFPSGHAAISWAAMTVGALYARLLLRVAPGVHVSFESAIACSPWVVSAWISASRIRDRWHNVDDVVAGAIIGTLCGAAAWRHYATHRRDALLGSPPGAGGVGEGRSAPISESRELFSDPTRGEWMAGSPVVPLLPGSRRGDEEAGGTEKFA